MSTAELIKIIQSSKAVALFLYHGELSIPEQRTLNNICNNHNLFCTNDLTIKEAMKSASCRELLIFENGKMKGRFKNIIPQEILGHLLTAPFV